MNNSEKENNNLGWYEILDRTSIIENNFNNFIVSHPILEWKDSMSSEEKEIVNLVDLISEKLHDLYQAVGAIALKD
jgi:hypothetical protein